MFQQNFKGDENITIEQVKACKIFSHFTDEQAQEVVDVIKSFTRIVYEHYQRIKEERERKELTNDSERKQNNSD